MNGRRNDATILVVDRSKVGLMFEETVLRRSNSRLLTASTGSTAWRAILSNHPDLVIFGYDLKDMTGPELCRKVRSSPDTRRVSLMLITERAVEDRLDLCLAAGCNDVLLRPFHRRDLDERVSRLLSIPVRRELRTLTRLEVALENAEFTALGHSLNVSANGMLVQVKQVIPPEAVIRVSFYLPADAHPLGFPARVVRAEFDGGAPRYGLHFDHVEADDRNRLESFVHRFQQKNREGS